jgi:hypothetical protein
METQQVHMKGVLSWLVHWARCASTRDFCPALAALVGPVQNICSSPYTVSRHFSTSPSKLVRQLCRVACLLICVSGGGPIYKNKKQILFVLKSRIDIICTIKPCYMITYKDKINWGLDIAPLHKENFVFCIYKNRIKMAKIKTL